MLNLFKYYDKCKDLQLLFVPLLILTNELLKMKERIAFVDYIRVVACLLVMVVHASELFYNMGPVSEVVNEDNRLWVSVYDGFFGRISVPLFIIVSAFLLVPMKQGTTMSQFYRRRFLRILPPLFCFLVLYSVLPATWGALTWDEAVEALTMVPFNFPLWAGHLWFMYPLISIYLIIPVVSPWLENAKAKDELIFLGIFAFSTLTPWLHRFVSPELWGECFWNNYSALWYCSGYLGYLVLAHFIRVHLKWSQRKRLAVGTLCFVVGAAFSAWSFWWKAEPGVQMETPMMEWSWEFCTPNVLLSTFGAFLLFTCITKAPGWINSLAKLTFGMYLMHIFFLPFIAEWIIGGDIANPILPVWIAIPTVGVLTYLCCMVVTKLVSLIPGSKYVIG